MSRRWYSSAVAARRDAPMVIFVGRCMIAYPCGLAEGSRGNVSPCWALTITGRSAAHIDRLARDWIGHGISPTKTGGRGVARPDRRERTLHGWRRVTSREALRRFDAAEARARRVVSR